MKLYYSKGACSFACRIIINELALTSDFEAVDLAKKLTSDGKNYYTINPKGSVPALLTNENDLLTENAVILQYLADGNKAMNLLPPVDQFKRYKVLEWLNYVATELHKGIGGLFNSKMPQEVKDNVLMPIIKSKLAYVNSHLEHNKFLNGEQFTLPDAYLFVMLMWTFHFNIHLQEFPHLSRYFSELSQRKSIRQSLSEEGIHLKA